MSTALYPYYERELLFIRQMTQEFAKQFPAAASRLMLQPNISIDPHVERLIESFALIAGRIHHKLDDEFPELTDAIFNILYPHYLQPVPSMAVVQFDLKSEAVNAPQGVFVPRHARLSTPAIGGLQCRFRTAYDTQLLPLTVTDAKLLGPPFPPGVQPPPRALSALRIVLEATGKPHVHEMQFDRLRFYLMSEGAVMARLYEVIFNHAIQVVCRPLDPGGKNAPVTLTPAQAIHQVGFGPDEGLLPYPRQTFLGYRLLTEFFSLPAKFSFFDLKGAERLCKAGCQRKFEVLIYLNVKPDRMEQAIDAGTFRLGCTPVVNLFEQTAEPIQLTRARSEYRLVPDVAFPTGKEVYSIDSVESFDPNTGRTTQYQPFYSFRHGQSRETQQSFWYATRKVATGENERGTDVYLHFVDLGFDPRTPADSSVVVRTLCTNRDVPVYLQQAREGLAFDLELAVPLRGIQCLRSPTTPLRPSMRRGAYWRLISHLTLNHLSLTDPEEGRPALQEILRLYDFADPEVNQQQAAIHQQLIESVNRVACRPVVGRIPGGPATGFVRGTEVTIDFDEQKYLGHGPFLFACVLERFLGLYVSANSFTQMVATTQNGQGVIKRWPPRAGEQTLV